MRAASFRSWSSDWIAVSRIRRANGIHCHDTISTIEVSGSSENQSTTPRPSERVIQAKIPFTGCISMFFQLSALTVGITNNGALARTRAQQGPKKYWTQRRGVGEG